MRRLADRAQTRFLTRSLRRTGSPFRPEPDASAHCVPRPFHRPEILGAFFWGHRIAPVTAQRRQGEWMTRFALSALFVAALSGCVSLTPGGAKVKVYETDHPASDTSARLPQGCR